MLIIDVGLQLDKKTARSILSCLLREIDGACTDGLILLNQSQPEASGMEEVIEELNKTKRVENVGPEVVSKLNFQPTNVKQKDQLDSTEQHSALSERNHNSNSKEENYDSKEKDENDGLKPTEENHYLKSMEERLDFESSGETYYLGINHRFEAAKKNTSKFIQAQSNEISYMGEVDSSSSMQRTATESVEQRQQKINYLDPSESALLVKNTREGDRGSKQASERNSWQTKKGGTEDAKDDDYATRLEGEAWHLEGVTRSTMYHRNRFTKPHAKNDDLEVTENKQDFTVTQERTSNKTAKIQESTSADQQPYQGENYGKPGNVSKEIKQHDDFKDSKPVTEDQQSKLPKPQQLSRTDDFSFLDYDDELVMMNKDPFLKSSEGNVDSQSNDNSHHFKMTNKNISHKQHIKACDCRSSGKHDSGTANENHETESKEDDNNDVEENFDSGIRNEKSHISDYESNNTDLVSRETVDNQFERTLGNHTSLLRKQSSNENRNAPTPSADSELNSREHSKQIQHDGHYLQKFISREDGRNSQNINLPKLSFESDLTALNKTSEPEEKPQNNKGTSSELASRNFVQPITIGLYSIMQKSADRLSIPYLKDEDETFPITEIVRNATGLVPEKNKNLFDTSHRVITENSKENRSIESPDNKVSFIKSAAKANFAEEAIAISKLQITLNMSQDGKNASKSEKRKDDKKEVRDEGKMNIFVQENVNKSEGPYGFPNMASVVAYLGAAGRSNNKSQKDFPERTNKKAHKNHQEHYSENVQETSPLKLLNDKHHENDERAELVAKNDKNQASGPSEKHRGFSGQNGLNSACSLTGKKVSNKSENQLFTTAPCCNSKASDVEKLQNGNLRECTSTVSNINYQQKFPEEEQKYLGNMASLYNEISEMLHSGGSSESIPTAAAGSPGQEVRKEEQEDYIDYAGASSNPKYGMEKHLKSLTNSFSFEKIPDNTRNEVNTKTEDITEYPENTSVTENPLNIHNVSENNTASDIPCCKEIAEQQGFVHSENVANPKSNYRQDYSYKTESMQNDYSQNVEWRCMNLDRGAKQIEDCLNNLTVTNNSASQTQVLQNTEDHVVSDIKKTTNFNDFDHNRMLANSVEKAHKEDETADEKVLQVRDENYNDGFIVKGALEKPLGNNELNSVEVTTKKNCTKPQQGQNQGSIPNISTNFVKLSLKHLRKACCDIFNREDCPVEHGHDHSTKNVEYSGYEMLASESETISNPDYNTSESDIIVERGDNIEVSDDGELEKPREAADEQSGTNTNQATVYEQYSQKNGEGSLEDLDLILRIASSSEATGTLMLERSGGYETVPDEVACCGAAQRNTAGMPPVTVLPSLLTRWREHFPMPKITVEQVSSNFEENSGVGEDSSALRLYIQGMHDRVRFNFFSLDNFLAIWRERSILRICIMLCRRNQHWR